MRHWGLRLTAFALFLGVLVLVISEGTTATREGPRSALTRATPRGATPTPISSSGGTVPGRPYGPGAVTPLQLLQMAKPGLIIYFPFDPDVYDRNNRTVPLDICGHLVYNNGAYMVPGRLRDSARFGPLAPMFISCPPSPNTISLDMTLYCTIAAWVFPERFGGVTGTDKEAILCRGVTTMENTLSYGLYLSAAGIPVFESRIGSGSTNLGPWTRQATHGVAPGRWNHVCAVFGAGTVSFYIDGRLAGQSQAPRALDPIRFPQAPVYIGARFVNDQTGEIRDPYIGVLDDLALWNRPLKAEEVALLATDTDVNGMADFWDLQITGHYPTPSAGTTPTSGTTPTPTPTPPPIRPPLAIQGAKTPTPPVVAPPGSGPPRSSPTPPPRVVRTPPRTGPSRPGDVPRAPGAPSATPSRTERQAPKPTPSAPSAPKIGGPGSKGPSAPPVGVRQPPTPTPTPRGDSDRPAEKAPPSSRSVR